MTIFSDLSAFESESFHFCLFVCLIVNSLPLNTLMLKIKHVWLEKPNQFKFPTPPRQDSPPQPPGTDDSQRLMGCLGEGKDDEVFTKLIIGTFSFLDFLSVSMRHMRRAHRGEEMLLFLVSSESSFILCDLPKCFDKSGFVLCNNEYIIGK